MKRSDALIILKRYFSRFYIKKDSVTYVKCIYNPLIWIKLIEEYPTHKRVVKLLSDTKISYDPNKGWEPEDKQ